MNTGNKLNLTLMKKEGKTKMFVPFLDVGNPKFGYADRLCPVLLETVVPFTCKSKFVPLVVLYMLKMGA